MDHLSGTTESASGTNNINITIDNKNTVEDQQQPMEIDLTA